MTVDGGGRQPSVISRRSSVVGRRSSVVHRPSSVIDHLRARLAAVGRITFAEFMADALYHPRWGYYCAGQPRLGAAGDFQTSPELHPAFGLLLGRQVEQAWRSLGEPAAFWVVEFGAGTGALAAGILDYARLHAPDWARALRYHIVETSPALVETQRARLATFEAQVDWHDSDADLPASPAGCVLANEFVDALPVHRVTRIAGRLVELYVAWRDGWFATEPGELSTPELAAYFDRLGVRPPEGSVAEVNLEAWRWGRRLGELLGRGVVLVVDYGFEAAELYSRPRPAGTLRGYFRQAWSDDPFDRVGQQDLTTHVDFTTLRLAAEAAGFELAGLVSQAAFLRQLGLGELLAGLRQLRLPANERRRNQAALEALVDPRGLGGFSVLALVKGAPAEPLDGLTPDNLRRAQLTPAVAAELLPLLPPLATPTWLEELPPGWRGG